jgi:hypothetical protein
MKKLAIAVIVAAVLGWLIVMLLSSDTRRSKTTGEWPMGLGALETVPKRYPNRATTAGAHELERLAAQAGIRFIGRESWRGQDAIGAYLQRQYARADASIDPAPPLGDAIAPLREHLLSGREIAWESAIERGQRAPLPNVRAHLQVGRLLAASALERARRGDAGGWDDLHAAWNLSHVLWRRPEILSGLIALAIDRNVIIAARKMPRPAPAWFDEVRTFDFRKAMMAATQGETYRIGMAFRHAAERDDESQNWLRRVIDRSVKDPYFEIARADFLAYQRETADLIAAVDTCAFDAKEFARKRAKALPWWNAVARVAMPNIYGMWQRVFRVRAEVELTEHALGLRSGPSSQCRDGQWIVTPDVVKFSRPVPVDGPASAATPLEFRRAPTRTTPRST